MPKSEEIVDILRRATEPLSLDQICKAAFGRVSERERGFVRVTLHRLDTNEKLVKYPRRYALVGK